MDNSNECAFDKELRGIINRSITEGMLSTGEVVAVIEFVKLDLMMGALKQAEDEPE